MWSRESPSSISNSEPSIFSPYRNRSSAQDRENIPPSCAVNEANSSLDCNSDVQSRANLFYLAKLNRNNPIRDTADCRDLKNSVEADDNSKNKKESLSEFSISFYENPPPGTSDSEEMRTSRRIKGISPKQPSAKRQNQRKTPVRKGVKRTQFAAADDSVMIISPEMNGNMDWQSPGGSGSSFLNDSREQKPKRMRLFDSSPKKGTSSSESMSNETIDLVDDDDYEDIVVVDEVNTRGTSNINNRDEDVEIVGIRVVPQPTNSRFSPRSGLPWLRSNGRRNSIKNSITFQEVNQAVKRAKRRMSNLNVSRTTATANNIKKQKKKKQLQQHLSQQQQQKRVNQKQIKRLAQINRRSTVPVYVLDRELGPQNPNWRNGGQPFHPQQQQQRPRPLAAEFIPISSVNSSLFPTTIAPTANTLTVSPQEINTGGSDVTCNVAPQGFNLLHVPGNVTRQRLPGTPRPIIIDASNVAMGHGRNLVFSCRGIKICVEYFRQRGHQEIIAFVPRFRQKSKESVDPQILNDLEKEGVLKLTPSREVGGKRISSYDDRYIVQYASEVKGIIISNDNYKDLYDLEDAWREQITYRLLQFTWVSEDCIMFPWDPLGRGGPSLERFLQF